MIKQERAIGQLRIRVWLGFVYLAGAAVWLARSHANDKLDSPVTLLWLGGSVAQAFFITRTARLLGKAKAGNLPPGSIEPDERAQFISGKAALNTFWWTICLLFAYLGYIWDSTGRLSAEPAAILLSVVSLYLGHYAYYLRRY